VRYRTFGKKTGLQVSELALGTGIFGHGPIHVGDDNEAKRIFDGYVEAGGNFIDTADTYSDGESEKLVGRFIASDRDHFALATKYTLGANSRGDVSKTGNSRKNMIRSVEASLRRLDVDHIDLYWVHKPDFITPIEEIMRGFDDLVQAGKIAYAGFSNFPAWKVAHASVAAELRGWAPLAGAQFEYSLIERSADRDVIPLLTEFGLGAALWSPLAGGLLTGKYREGGQGRQQAGNVLVHTERSGREKRIVDAVLKVATDLGATPGQIALAWMLHADKLAKIGAIPIIGARTRAQLDENLATLSVDLSPSQLGELNEASKPNSAIRSNS
jgi:aryl-alcohol dehydrogenase-like predicted oxidoreductase